MSSDDSSTQNIDSMDAVASGGVSVYEPPAVTVLGTLAELTLDVKQTLHNYDATMPGCDHAHGTDDSHKSCV